MSEKEMNSYRFTSGDEPSDEMLTQLMKEVAHDAKERHEKATSAYFEQMRKNIEIKKLKWANLIRIVANG